MTAESPAVTRVRAPARIGSRIARLEPRYGAITAAIVLSLMILGAIFAGVPEELLGRYPHEVSEGQLQRAMVARALACEPDYLVSDEPTSMLDVSSQAGVLRAIETAQQRTGLGVLLISHDAELVGYWCSRVLRLGDPTPSPE